MMGKLSSYAFLAPKYLSNSFSFGIFCQVFQQAKITEEFFLIVDFDSNFIFTELASPEMLYDLWCTLPAIKQTLLSNDLIVY